MIDDAIVMTAPLSPRSKAPGEMQRVVPDLAALAIDTGQQEAIAAEIVPPEDASRSLHDSYRPTVLQRSDTADSLKKLVGKSPSLAHLEDISFLPSPVAPARFHNSIAQTLSPSTTASPIHDGRHDVLQSLSNRTETHGLLPPKLFDRLQKEQRTHRTISLAPTQDLGKIEMPRMVRHRSQTRVDHENNEPLHREVSHQKIAQHHLHRAPEYAVQPNHSLAASAEVETFDVLCHGQQRRTFSALTVLGEGSFSRVVLARSTDNHKEVVAIKIVSLDSPEMENQARVAMTVCREIDLLEKVSSPLIIKLRGCMIADDCALLVLDYLPGGDLFTLAAENRSLLTPSLVKRIFAEIVCAVRTLHEHNIVHRDLKLENILLRYPKNVLRNLSPATPLLTALTDLGLAREFDPAAPNLTTRCGSEDYAAPELIMGQAYDGRQTDAWALGVVLYSMLEGRLPFDVIPGLEHRMKSKVLHRICRIEWRWVALKDPGTYAAEWEGAKRIVVNLLRSRTKRWSLHVLAQDEWIREEMCIVEALVRQAGDA